MTLRNGYLTAKQLAPIGQGKFLAVDVAPFYRAMAEDFEDVFGYEPHCEWGYRDMAGQVAMKLEHGAGAAAPGTSDHGLGRSVDLWSGINIQGSPEHTWMERNAARYGFVENITRARGYSRHEPWHWTFMTTPTINLKERQKMQEADRKMLREVHAAVTGPKSDLAKTKTAAGRTETRMRAILGKLGIKDPVK